MMKQHVVESWLLLLQFEWIMRFRGFSGIHKRVRAQTVNMSPARVAEASQLSRAMDYACVLYFKRVLCLQRSAAVTILLRRHGFNAAMVIGAQMLPFQSHAWVELDGTVLNDKPYIPSVFQELARC